MRKSLWISVLFLIVSMGLLPISGCSKATREQCQRALLNIQEIEWRARSTERVAGLPEDQQAAMRKLLDEQWIKQKHKILEGAAGTPFMVECTDGASTSQVECIIAAKTTAAYRACSD